MLVNWPAVYGLQHWNGEESVGMPPLDQLFREPGFEWDGSKYDRSALQCFNRTETGGGDDTFVRCCAADSHVCETTKRLRGIESGFQCHHFTNDAASSDAERDDDNNNKPLHARVVRILTWDYFMPALQLNPYYSSLLQTLERHSSQSLFSILARTLLRPTTQIQSTIDSFVDNKFQRFDIISSCVCAYMCVCTCLSLSSFQYPH
jgi:hypothetical protein